jgi:hypothetical protein
MLRKTVQVIGVVEGVLLLGIIVLVITSNSDPAGDAMAAAFGTLAAIALAVFVFPALLAVRKNRFLKLALALVVLPPLAIMLIGLSSIA